MLEEDNPSARYSTLTEILEKSDKDPDIKESKDSIINIGVVPKILEKQKIGDYWRRAEDLRSL